jgi:MFS transporter, DHA1 family, multidrug resistance protein
MARPTTPGDRAGRDVPVVLLGALSAMGPLSMDLYLPGLPRMADDLGTAASPAQLTVTACLLGLAVGQLVAGPVSDARGRRGPLLVGLVAYGVASALCALAPTVWVLVALRFVQGLAGAAGIVIARAVVRDRHTGVAAARFFALLMLVNGLAPILAPLIGGALLQVTSWRGIFVVLAGAGAVLALAAATGLPETLAPDRRHTGGLRATTAAFGTLLGDRAFVGYALSSGLAFAAMFAYIAGSPFVLQDLYGLSPQLFSVVFGANALGIVALSQVSGALVARTGPRRLLALGMCASAGGAAVLLLGALAGLGLWGLLVPLWVVVASIGLIAPNATALGLASHGEHAGSASALIGMAQFSLGAVAAPLVGLGGGDSAVGMATVIAALGAGGLATFAALTRGDRPAAAQPQAPRTARTW